MAHKINGDLVVLGAFKNLKPEVLATEPTLGELGTAPRIWVNGSGALRLFNGTAIETLGGATAFNYLLAQDLDAGNHKITNLAAPVSGTDAVRKIDLDQALTGLDFQPDINGLESSFGSMGGRFIYEDGTKFTKVGFETVAAGDIVVVGGDGAITAIAYDISAHGDGALVWDQTRAIWLRLASGVWGEFGGLSGVTATSGLQKTGSDVSLKLADASLVVDASGVKVGDLSGTYALKTNFDNFVARIEASYFNYHPVSAGTTITVTHNFGNKYPMVQVVDDADDTVMAVDQIKFVDTNTLTITLAVAGTPRVIVQGLKAAV